MTITLKQNQSSDNRINKVFSSTTKAYDVYLLDETNILNPVFVLVAALKDVEKFSPRNTADKDVHRRRVAADFNRE